jgi:hypothetical protein
VSPSTLLVPVIAGVVATTIGLAPSQATRFPESTILSQASLSEAVALGLRGDVDIVPYFFSELHVGRHPHPRTAVYTPFVRVALAVQTARRRGAVEFDAGSLPDWVTEPTVLVVFGGPCAGAPPCDFHGGQYDDLTPLTYVGIGPLISMPQVAHLSRRADAMATTTVHPFDVFDDLSFLHLIGGPPFEHARVAATFAPEGFQPGWTVFAQWTLPSRSHVLRGGIVTNADLAAWR